MTHLEIRVGRGHVMWGEHSVTHCLTHISCRYLVVNTGISQVIRAAYVKAQILIIFLRDYKLFQLSRSLNSGIIIIISIISSIIK